LQGKGPQRQDGEKDKGSFTKCVRNVCLDGGALQGLKRKVGDKESAMLSGRGAAFTKGKLKRGAPRGSNENSRDSKEIEPKRKKGQFANCFKKKVKGKMGAALLHLEK